METNPKISYRFAYDQEYLMLVRLKDMTTAADFQKLEGPCKTARKFMQGKAGVVEMTEALKGLSGDDLKIIAASSKCSLEVLTILRGTQLDLFPKKA